MNKLPNLVSYAWKAFFAIFIAMFGPGILFIFFVNRHVIGTDIGTGLSNIGLLFITTALVMPFLIFTWRFFQRLNISEKVQRRILIIFLVVSAILQFIIGNRLRFTPIWDIEAIFEGARLWMQTGTLDYPAYFHTTYETYFARFSNQWGALVLFRWLFWLYERLGGTDFHFAALAWNVVMVQVMAFSLYASAKRLKGPNAGLYVLFLLAVFLPFHFFGAVYYTDTLSMPFVAIAFYLYLRGKDEERLGRKIAIFALCGLAVTVGVAIKFNAIIILIAIAIDYLLTNERKGWHLRLISIGTAAIIVITLLSGFFAYMNRLIGPEMIDRHRTPRMHWVMMGFNHNFDGRYNRHDDWFTIGIPDLETRQSETSRVARERIRGLGVGGVTRLAARKFAFNFGDGTYELHRILFSIPHNETVLHQLVLIDGGGYSAYKHIATGFTTAFLILMLAGAILAFKKHENTAVPWLSFFGLALILTVWETGARITMNFFPMLVIGAIIGLSVINPLLTTAFSENPSGNKKRR